MTAPVGFTAELVRQARATHTRELTAAEVQLAGQCLLDWIGVTVAGSAEPAARLVRDDTLADGTTGAATLIGTGEQVGAGPAALVNGTAAHALDYDDVVPAMSGHPSAPVIAALLPLAEVHGLDGSAFTAAFLAGFDTECRVGRLLAPGHYGSGWHATGTLGTLGAAAASAHALDLTEPQWRQALGIAATQAAGLRGVFGTMSKPLHAGNAALHGQRAARLAQRGFTSNPDIIETAFGFAAVLSETAGGNAFSDAPELANVLFKYHAACYGAHAAMDAVAHASDGVDPPSVASVRLYVPPSVLAQCGRRHPLTPLEAKFSLPFAVALVLTGTSTGPEGFSRELGRVDLRSLSDRVDLRADPGRATFSARAEVMTTDGRLRTAEADVSVAVPSGHLDCQQRRLENKFAALTTGVLEDRAVATILEQCRRLPEIPDLRSVTQAAVRAGVRRGRDRTTR